MLLIKKSEPPEGLAELRDNAEELLLSENDAYKTLRNPLKNEVRKSLMKEQGHLCAYCMRRIPDERILETDEGMSDINIEHWLPRSKAQERIGNYSLDYYNMFAVCSGNEKAPDARNRKRAHFTCDKKKNNQELKINPTDPDTINMLKYSSDGIIMSTDPEINEDINNKLNLNCNVSAVTLPENRKEVLETVQKDIYSQGDDKDSVLKKCKEQLEIWENETDPKTPYIGIAIWWLKDMIKDLS